MLFFATLCCVYGQLFRLKTEGQTIYRAEKTSAPSYKSQLKILPFPGLAKGGPIGYSFIALRAQVL